MTALLPALPGNPIADQHAEQLQLAAEHARMVEAADALELRAVQASKDAERRDHHQQGG